MYLTKFRNIPIQIYKNPKNLDNLSEWAKGIITADGDLWMMEFDYKKGDVFHIDLIKWLYRNGNIDCKNGLVVNRNDNLFNHISIIRMGFTNEFCLSDSYSSHVRNKLQEDMKEIFGKVKIQNPKYEFII